MGNKYFWVPLLPQGASVHFISFSSCSFQYFPCFLNFDICFCLNLVLFEGGLFQLPLAIFTA